MPVLHTDVRLIGSEIFFVMWPLAPLLLAFSASRLAFSHRRSILALVSRLPWPTARPLAAIIKSNLRRHHARNAAVSVLLAFAVASSVLSLSVSSMESMAVDREVAFAAGADLVMEFSAPNVTWLAGADLPGLRAYAIAVPLSAVLVSLPYAAVDVIGVDFDSYQTVAYSLPVVFLEGSPDALSSAMDQAVTTGRLAEDADVSVGDELSLSILDEHTIVPMQTPQYRNFSLTVAGVVIGLPGLSQGGEFGALYITMSSIGPVTLVSAWSNETRCCLHRYTMLADIEPGKSARAIGEQIGVLARTAYIEALGREATPPEVRIQVAEDVGRRLREDPFRGGLLALLDVQFALSVAAGTGFIGIVVYQNLRDRSPILARLRARGASRRDLVSIVLVELLAVITLATVFGMLIGIGSFLAFREVLEAREPLVLTRPSMAALPDLALAILAPGLLALALTSALVLRILSRPVGPTLRLTEG